MKYRIQAVGKPALDYARAGIGEYQKRLGRHARLTIDYLRDESKFGPLPQGTFRVVLDERGTLLDTAEFTATISRWEGDPAIKAVAFQIAGAGGHDPQCRDTADFLLALSPLTLQHELALLVLLEQLYRVHMIKAGTPYHR
ncbi:23S rRNA (pseudouridine(1915)-N(3))-methyltransferase RlmH [soil metagenome]